MYILLCDVNKPDFSVLTCIRDDEKAQLYPT